MDKNILDTPWFGWKPSEAETTQVSDLRIFSPSLIIADDHPFTSASQPQIIFSKWAHSIATSQLRGPRFDSEFKSMFVCSFSCSPHVHVGFPLVVLFPLTSQKNMLIGGFAVVNCPECVHSPLPGCSPDTHPAFSGTPWRPIFYQVFCRIIWVMICSTFDSVE